MNVRIALVVACAPLVAGCPTQGSGGSQDNPNQPSPNASILPAPLLSADPSPVHQGRRGSRRHSRGLGRTLDHPRRGAAGADAVSRRRRAAARHAQREGRPRRHARSVVQVARRPGAEQRPGAVERRPEEGPREDRSPRHRRSRAGWPHALRLRLADLSRPTGRRVARPERALRPPLGLARRQRLPRAPPGYPAGLVLGATCRRAAALARESRSPWQGSAARPRDHQARDRRAHGRGLPRERQRAPHRAGPASCSADC